MKIIISLAICLFMTTPSFANTEIETYPKETCKEIYGAIATFLVLANAEWEKQNEEKALLYSTASANYATIYEATCKE